MAVSRREVTEFEVRVYRAIERIPPGRVATYGDVARAVGCGSSRAVGQALRRNPFAPDVPCHRVIAGDLTIGGFAGSRCGEHIRRKIRLLANEGVLFEGGRLVDVSRCVPVPPV